MIVLQEVIKMVKKRACVFISGNGTNLNNLILKSRDYNFPISINLVVCNNKKMRSFFLLNKHKVVVDKLIEEKKAGFVYADISLGIKNMLHKLIEPVMGHEPFAEVEKVVYQIKRFF